MSERREVYCFHQKKCKMANQYKAGDMSHEGYYYCDRCTRNQNLKQQTEIQPGPVQDHYYPRRKKKDNRKRNKSTKL